MQFGKTTTTLAVTVLVSMTAGCEQQQAAQTPPAAPATAPETAPAPAPVLTGDAALIQSAMSAAPEAVAKDAAVMEMKADGSMREVRAGTNGFTCVPDNPVTPGPDPMCADANASAWIGAWVKREKPAADKVGFIYMLAGGTDASNTDPYAAQPATADHWISTGPHLMIVNAPSLNKIYPASPDPDTSKPYVMWAGTPYEHVMAPVK